LFPFLFEQSQVRCGISHGYQIIPGYLAAERENAGLDGFFRSLEATASFIWISFRNREFVKRSPRVIDHAQDKQEHHPRGYTPKHVFKSHRGLRKNSLICLETKSSIMNPNEFDVQSDTAWQLLLASEHEGSPHFGGRRTCPDADAE
jgi:hypothetical protein